MGLKRDSSTDSQTGLNGLPGYLYLGCWAVYCIEDRLNYVMQKEK